MADIFIGYKSERRNAARHLARILSLHGYSVWWDYALLSGVNFNRQIEDELRASSIVLILWCNLSIKSRWVQEEAYLADRLQKILPIFLEDVVPPYGFALIEGVDLIEWDGAPRSNSLDRLLSQLETRCPPPYSPEPPRKQNIAALRDYEDDWRGFGAPSLAQFSLVPPVLEQQSQRLSTAEEQNRGRHKPTEATWKALSSSYDLKDLKFFQGTLPEDSPLANKVAVQIRLAQHAQEARARIHSIERRAWSCSATTLLAEQVLDGSSVAGLHVLADQGDLLALTLLGCVFEHGLKGIAVDRVRAVDCYRQAAAKGVATAQNNLGHLLLDFVGDSPPNEVEAVEYFRHAAASGDARAQSNLGVMYASGRGGLEKDDERAAHLFELSALQAYPRGQSNLGYFYEMGRGGLEKDLQKARELYKLAAQHGDALARTRLWQLD